MIKIEIGKPFPPRYPLWSTKIFGFKKDHILLGNLRVQLDQYLIELTAPSTINFTVKYHDSVKDEFNLGEDLR